MKIELGEQPRLNRRHRPPFREEDLSIGEKQQRRIFRDVRRNGLWENAAAVCCILTIVNSIVGHVQLHIEIQLE